MEELKNDIKIEMRDNKVRPDRIYGFMLRVLDLLSLRQEPEPVVEEAAPVPEPVVEEAAPVPEPEPEPVVEEAAPVPEPVPEPVVEEAAPVPEPEPEPVVDSEEVEEP